MVLPEPAEAPVMEPVIVPMVHAKLLAALAVSDTLGFVPLQADAVLAVVTTGLGLTVNVIVKGLPTQPEGEVGVTIYCMVPDAELLGLVSTWLIVLPDPALPPVIPPVIVPMVQLKLLAASAVSDRLGLVPLHMAAVGELVTVGVVSETTTRFAVTGKQPVLSVTETV